MDYATKNTFVLRDSDGDATFVTGKGKSASTITETIYPILGTGEDPYFWDIHAGAADDLIDARGSVHYAYLYGDTGNDTIYGSTGYFNHIEGGDGNDLIDARLVGSMTQYPSGHTELLGGSGADALYGGGGEDFIDGGAGRDIIDAGAGSDRVVYDATDIRVEGDGGRDTIDASSAAATNVRSGKGVTIDLSSNRDIYSNFEDVIGSNFNDVLTGDNSDNRFDGGAGNDTIDAGGGNDFVVYDPSDTSVDGGFDWDAISGEDSPVGMNLDLTATTYRNFETVDGSRFDDVIKGDSNRQTIYGNDGGDVIDGGVGYDYIHPGSGNDTWVYDPADEVYEYFDESEGSGPYAGGIDTIDASTAAGPVGIDLSYYQYRGFDNLIGSAGGDGLTGSDFDNVIEGGAGADLINGGGSMHLGDTASYAGSSAAVTVNLGTGTGSGGDAEGDQLSNIEVVLGTQFGDVLTGDANTNYLEGGAGADQLDGGGAGEGVPDIASYAGSAVGLTVSLADPSLNTGDAAGDSYANIGSLLGTSYDDVLFGDDQDNYIIDGTLIYGQYFFYGQGDDWIDGGAGVDRIMTGAGNDTVVYDANDGWTYDEGGRDPFGNFINTFDTVDASSATSGVTVSLDVNYNGFDRVIGSAFADALTGNGDDSVFEGGAGADSLDGGWAGGSDTASYAGSAAVAVDLGLNTATGGDAEGDTFANIDNLAGSAFADTLTGDSNDNVLEGRDGADQLNGGAGLDTASYAGSAAAVTIHLNSVFAGSGGDAAGDTLSSIENLIGSNFIDTFSGDGGNNRIEGAGGADDMIGDAGQDTFVYKSFSDSVELEMDDIYDFTWGSSGDVIDFSALQMDWYVDLAYHTTAFSSFTEVKAEAESVLSGWREIFVATDGADTYVFMNKPGDYGYDAGEDMLIKLVGVHDLSSLSADNFFNGGGYVFTENLG
ncbi:MAG: calcium-binding protein [Ramlibacter sp.]|nr:calcium-binding protein [Ramlibacter sp.]